LEGIEGLKRDETLLRSSVNACDQYLDDLLSATAVHIDQTRQLSKTAHALNHLRQIRTNFLDNASEHIDSEKTRLSSLVARPAIRDAESRLDDLMDSDWMRYSTHLFRRAVTSASKTNATERKVRSAHFAEFLEADSELSAVERWTASVDKRYAPCSVASNRQQEAIASS